MSHLPYLPDDILVLIAKTLVLEDDSDRWWTILTRLLYPRRRRPRWLRSIRDMHRPMVLRFAVHNPIGRLCLLFLRFSPQILADIEIEVGVDGMGFHARRAYTVNRKVHEIAVSVGDIFGDTTVFGGYTMRLQWDPKAEVIGFNCGQCLLTYFPAIGSFGTHNITSFGAMGHFTHAKYVRWPYVLPPTIRTLAHFASGDLAFADTAIQYWDTQNVSDMTGFVQDAYNFRGDLSRYVVRKKCKLEGAFAGSSAVALPENWLRRKTTRLGWAKIALLHPVLWAAIQLMLAGTVCIAILFMVRAGTIVNASLCALWALLAFMIWIAMDYIKLRRSW